MAGLEKRPLYILADVVSGEIGTQPAAANFYYDFRRYEYCFEKETRYEISNIASDSRAGRNANIST